MSVVLRTLLATLLLAPTCLAAAEPEPARWVSRWDRGECQLIRAVGDTERLGINVVPGSGRVSIWVFPTGEAPPPAHERIRAVVTVAPAGQALRSESVRRLRHGEGSAYAIDLPETALAALAAATGVQVDVDGRRVLDLPLRSAAAAIDVQRQCMADQLRSWGIDPAALAALRQRPRALDAGGIAGFVSAEDYPREALDRQRSGLTVLRLDVGRQGQVERCTILNAGADPALDTRTCAVLQRRARFEAALDADGAAVAAPIVGAIDWQLVSVGL